MPRGSVPSPCIVTAALGWFLIRRTFRPLTRIEDTAAQIAVGDLTQRVDVPDTDDEVASLSRSLNAMLARIEQSFAVREANEAKMRRFIADASHELRTPLAAVGGYAELYRQGALPTADAVTGAMGRIESEAHRMSGLVEDLLTLARLDGERPLELQTVDLAVLAADAAQDARTIAPDRHFVATGINGPIEPTELQADEQQLRQVVTNLVTNARVHTPAGTPIEILVGRRRTRSTSRSTCATTDTAYRPTSAPTSSSASTAPTAHAVAAGAAATGSGSRSCTRSSRRTAAAFGCVRRPVAGRRSSSSSPFTARDDGE